MQNEQEAKAFLRSLNYIRGLERNSKKTVIGVLYSKSLNSSKVDADIALEKITEAIKKNPSKGTLETKIIEFDDIEQDKNIDILMINASLYPKYSELKEISEKNKILNISMDPACAEQESCAISIQVKKGIEIFLNEKALTRSGYDVDAAFRFMATRI